MFSSYCIYGRAVHFQWGHDTLSRISALSRCYGLGALFLTKGINKTKHQQIFFSTRKCLYNWTCINNIEKKFLARWFFNPKHFEFEWKKLLWSDLVGVGWGGAPFGGWAPIFHTFLYKLENAINFGSCMPLYTCMGMRISIYVLVSVHWRNKYLNPPIQPHKFGIWGTETLPRYCQGCRKPGQAPGGKCSCPPPQYNNCFNPGGEQGQATWRARVSCLLCRPGLVTRQPPAFLPPPRKQAALLLFPKPLSCRAGPGNWRVKVPPHTCHEMGRWACLHMPCVLLSPTLGSSSKYQPCSAVRFQAPFRTLAPVLCTCPPPQSRCP